jgi:hypothetical protein
MSKDKKSPASPPTPPPAPRGPQPGHESIQESSKSHDNIRRGDNTVYFTPPPPPPPKPK